MTGIRFVPSANARGRPSGLRGDWIQLRPQRGGDYKKLEVGANYLTGDNQPITLYT
jgi:hypothetical protein